MTIWAEAHSISRPAKELLLKDGFAAQVMGVFERACNLVTDDGKVVALVIPEIGNGPFNIVVDGDPAFFSKIKSNTPVTLVNGQLQLDALRVDLSGATLWEPHPDWDKLRTRQVTIFSHLPFLRTVGHHHAPGNSFLALLEPAQSNDAILFTARKAGETLRNGWAGDRDQLQTAAIGLAGLGSGLTPAGDDFLAGVMLWAWLTHPTPNTFCRTLLDVAAPRTTTLSATFLQAAARGECSNPWHVLLTALSAESESDIETAAQKVLAHGATSGADTLAGFLYLAEKK